VLATDLDRRPIEPTNDFLAAHRLNFASTPTAGLSGHPLHCGQQGRPWAGQLSRCADVAGVPCGWGQAGVKSAIEGRGLASTATNPALGQKLLARLILKPHEHVITVRLGFRNSRARRPCGDYSAHGITDETKSVNHFHSVADSVRDERKPRTNTERCLWSTRTDGSSGLVGSYLDEAVVNLGRDGGRHGPDLQRASMSEPSFDGSDLWGQVWPQRVDQCVQQRECRRSLHARKCSMLTNTSVTANRPGQDVEGMIFGLTGSSLGAVARSPRLRPELPAVRIG
jgi:hypothetical protein